MWYGCGVDAAAVTVTFGNIENMNVWILSCGAVVEQHMAALRNRCHAASAAESGHICIFLPILFFLPWTCVDSYLSFQDASNHDQG